MKRIADRSSLCAIIILIASLVVIGSVYGDVLCSSSTAHTVTLTWTAPTDAGGAGNATQYDIRYSTSPITEQNFASATPATNIPTPKTAGTDESMVVTNLNASTNYYFGIKSADADLNWSPLSGVVCRSTLSSDSSTAPEAVTTLSAINTTSTQVVLEWLAPQTATGGTVSGYIVQYSTDSITEAVLPSATRVVVGARPQAPGEQEQVTISNLEASTTYYFVVRSRNSNFVWSSLSNNAVNAGSPHVSSVAPIYAYPNPFRTSEADHVIFTSIPMHSNLVLLTVSGDLVRRWTDNSGSDVSWDGTNEAGEAVGSGVYLWYIEGTPTKGRLIVIR